MSGAAPFVEDGEDDEAGQHWREDQRLTLRSDGVALFDLHCPHHFSTDPAQAEEVMCAARPALDVPVIGRPPGASLCWVMMHLQPGVHQQTQFAFAYDFSTTLHVASLLVQDRTQSPLLLRSR